MKKIIIALALIFVINPVFAGVVGSQCSETCPNYNYTKSHKSDNSAKAENICFTIGSTKDVVLAVQGTPTGVSRNTWYYEVSYITFDDNGKVIGYSNMSNNLKVKLY